MLHIFDRSRSEVIDGNGESNTANGESLRVVGGKTNNSGGRS